MTTRAVSTVGQVHGRPVPSKSMADPSRPSPWPTPPLPVRANGQWPRPKQPCFFPNWGRPRPCLRPCPHPPAFPGCSSYGTGHSHHRPLLPTDLAILLLNLDHLLDLDHRPWPWPGPFAPSSQLSPLTIVLVCSQTHPRRLLASATDLGRLFPQLPDVWCLAAIQKDKETEKDSERQGWALKKSIRQTNHPPSVPCEPKIGGGHGHGHGHDHGGPVRRNQGREGN